MGTAGPTIYKVYCDESRHTGRAKYRLLGSIWMQEDECKHLVREFLARAENRPGLTPDHMKWTKVPSSSGSIWMGYYIDLIDLFFEYARRQKVFYRAVIVDLSYQFDNRQYHAGDYEKGFYKLYYQLLVHPLRQDTRYHIRLAKRPVKRRKGYPGGESARLSELHTVLNNGHRKLLQYPLGYEPVVLTVEARDARTRYLIQLSDILTGAVGFHWNGLHKERAAKEGKVFLAGYIAAALGRSDLRFTTARNARPLDLFYLKPGM